MSSSRVPESVQSEIKIYTKKHVVKKNLKADVDVKYFLNHGIVRSRALKLFLVKNAIENVPMLRKMDYSGLEKLCEYMKAEVYKEDDCIVHLGSPVKMMTFIIQGEIVYNNTVIPNNPNFSLMKGDYHEESIVIWVLQNYKRSYYDRLPISTGRAICRRKVEALVLNASDLIRFTKKNESQDDQLPVEITWKRPEPGWVKLNCSVVWNPGTKVAAIGYVCRDDKGAFMAAESQQRAKPFMDRFFAEAYSIKRAIEFCRNSKKINLQGKVGIMVESDNQDLIKCLNDHNIDSNERISYQLRPVLEKIVSESAKKPTITFGHCKRQSNAAAKCVADHAVVAPNLSSWKNDAPDWLSSSLEQDNARLNEKPPSTSEQNHELVGKLLDIVIE
ncbi:hypothetical protein M0R45_015224 [Rubus argutus]|uniref:Cyclic nucleotide-binding domain-containing protein n=1 Tax=Rubus argutus TaxID=59490 RepID=A0AAW1XNN7_RUBAR